MSITRHWHVRTRADRRPCTCLSSARGTGGPARGPACIRTAARAPFQAGGGRRDTQAGEGAGTSSLTLCEEKGDLGAPTSPTGKNTINKAKKLQKSSRKTEHTSPQGRLPDRTAGTQPPPHLLHPLSPHSATPGHQHPSFLGTPATLRAPGGSMHSTLTLKHLKLHKFPTVQLNEAHTGNIKNWCWHSPPLLQPQVTSRQLCNHTHQRKRFT